MSTRALAGLLGKPTTPLTWKRATVTATHTGPNRLDIKVSASGTDILGVRYLASYTPTAGDTVEVLDNGTDRIVLGLLA